MKTVPLALTPKISINAGDGCIITHNGKWFNVLDPDPDDVDIQDIAHSLSLQGRFTGHTREFYSVAQHSVLVADHCPSDFALIGLLHDGSEAYLSDMARPIKKHPDFGPFYLAAEKRVQDAIFKHFGLPLEMPKEVEYADNLLLRTEARDLMPDSFPVYEGAVLEEEIIPWTPKRAKKEFLMKFYELTNYV
jgi:5'-nucleotidase